MVGRAPRFTSTPLAMQDPAQPPAVPATPPRPLPARVADVFLAPGRLGDELRERPAWVGAALLGLAVALIGTALLPPEIFLDAFREGMIAQGEELPESEMISGELFRAFALASVAVFWFIVLFVTAGLMTLVFSLVLGGQGRYLQHLAATAHAFVISAFGAIVVTPIRVSTRNPETTLGLGTFLAPILEDGYLLRFASGLDFFALWSWAVLGVVISRFDDRMSARMGAAWAVSLVVGFVAILAAFGD